MKFEEMLTLVKDQPVFETGLLLTGNADPKEIRRQLSRWSQTEKIHQLRRGVYTLAPLYQHIPPHPFLAANKLLVGSYVSLQSALAYYGMIPESVPRTTSVTMSRPAQWDGGFMFQHLAPQLCFGYQSVEVLRGQYAFIAFPEKALLDLAHLTPDSDSFEYLSELRLQNLEQLNLRRLNEFAERSKKPKWKRVARQVEKLARQEQEDYEELEL
jgi:hypothetical protein